VRQPEPPRPKIETIIPSFEFDTVANVHKSGNACYSLYIPLARMEKLVQFATRLDALWKADERVEIHVKTPAIVDRGNGIYERAKNWGAQGAPFSGAKRAQRPLLLFTACLVLFHISVSAWSTRVCR
jgi:galactokinase/mevalonate kinase-like predicted kinase